MKQEKDNPWRLTDKEVEVLCLIAEMGRVKRVANAIGSNDKTVEIHCAHIRQKMNVDSIIPAAVQWDRHVYGRMVANERGTDFI